MSGRFPPLGGEAVFGPASRQDGPALASIDAGSPQPWGVAAFEAEMEQTPPALFTLREADQAIAFVVVRIRPPEMDILNLAVTPSRRRRGLGRRLLKSTILHAAGLGVETVFLEVREGNREARALYEKAGFEQTQRRPGFYREPREDALLLRLLMSHFTG